MKRKQIKLENLVNLDSGGAFKSKFFTENDGIPLIRIRNVSKGYSKTYYNGEYDEKYIVNKGDFLITMDGEFRINEWSGEKSLLNQRVCRISVSSLELSSRYLLHFLPLALKKIEDKTSFVTVKHLSMKDIREIKTPLPPIDIQIKIAKALDKAEELIDNRKTQIEKYDELLQSVFIDMFGDFITNPKGWKKGTIRGLLKEAKYGTGKKADEKKGEYPVLRMNNITYKGNWNFKSLKYVDLEEKELEKYLVYKGDILFNRTNSKELVGKTAVYMEEKTMAYAGYLVRLRTNENGNPHYISTYLNSHYGKVVLKNMCKSIVGMANINAQEVQDIKILHPPIELQNQFAEIVEKVGSEKKKLEKSLAELENNFNSIMQKAFKGELF